jgi:hypothetical protein
MRSAMVDHREMEEEDNHRRVGFLVRLDMNLLRLKKVSTKSISLTDKLFRINKILVLPKIMTVNLSKTHRKNQEVENHKKEEQKTSPKV